MANKPSNADRIYEDLKQSLTSSKPFRRELITEQELADQYGVSRMPVRDALTRLCTEGYLTKYRSKGYVVQNIDNITLREQMELRYFMELGAMHKIIETATPEELNALRDMLDEPTPDRESVIANNARFHTSLISLAGNEAVTNSVSQLAQNLRYTLTAFGSFSNQAIMMKGTHTAIIDALIERDFEKAADYLKTDMLADHT